MVGRVRLDVMPDIRCIANGLRRIANLFWWCDREKGVAGMIASQVLPFGDAAVMGQWFACEKAVYDAVS